MFRWVAVAVMVALLFVSMVRPAAGGEPARAVLGAGPVSVPPEVIEARVLALVAVDVPGYDGWAALVRESGPMLPRVVLARKSNVAALLHWSLGAGGGVRMWVRKTEAVPEGLRRGLAADATFKVRAAGFFVVEAVVVSAPAGQKPGLTIR